MSGRGYGRGSRRRSRKPATMLAIAAVAFVGWLFSGADASSFIERIESEVAGGLSGGSTSAEVAGADVPPAEVEQARGQLDALAVAEPRNEGSYDREEWEHWSAASTSGWGDTLNGQSLAGCDARDAALIRDGKGVEVYGEYCSLEGSWTGPYSGFTTTDSSEMDIDHVVPLAAAHRSGGYEWSAAAKEEYANDPSVLLTTEAGANREKSDMTPDEWMPANESYHCRYAVEWISVKGEYGLTVTADERSALEEEMSGCAA